MAGYAKKSLVKKLGIKPNSTLCFMHPPQDYLQLLGSLPENCDPESSLTHYEYDFIHYFVIQKNILAFDFIALKNALKKNGQLWISWPKGTSKLRTNLTENVIREIGLQHGLVDIKVVAIDKDWSGLKFVYRLTDRK